MGKQHSVAHRQDRDRPPSRIGFAEHLADFRSGRLDYTYKIIWHLCFLPLRTLETLSDLLSTNQLFDAPHRLQDSASGLSALASLSNSGTLAKLMKRPSGLVLSAIALGLLAASTLFVIGLLLVSALTVHDNPSAALLGFGVIAVPLVALLVWFTLTLIGLLRFRSGARTSVVVLAVLLLFAAFGDFAITTIAYVVTQHHAQGSPSQMLAFSLGELLPGVIFLALGVWWLVYFNRPAVAALFQPAWLRTTSAVAAPYSQHTPYAYQPAPQPYGHAYAPPSVQSSAFPQVARPYPPRAPGSFDRVPASIQLIAWLLLFGAACGLIAALLPFPVFFLGSVIPGIAGHIVWALLAFFTGLTGWGLLRLDNRARLMAYAYLIFGFVNVPSQRCTFTTLPRCCFHLLSSGW